MVLWKVPGGMSQREVEERKEMGKQNEGGKKMPIFFFPMAVEDGFSAQASHGNNRNIWFLRLHLIKSDMVSELCFFLVWAPQKETLSSRSSSGR